jgi:hypothetical protein
MQVVYYILSDLFDTSHTTYTLDKDKACEAVSSGDYEVASVLGQADSPPKMFTDDGLGAVSEIPMEQFNG